MESAMRKPSLPSLPSALGAVRGGAGSTETVLVARTRVFLCALPIAAVVETMRPLPIRSMPGAPRFVRGLAIVRGEPLPVIDLGALLGAQDETAGGRFVTLRSGPRHLVALVDEVVGVRVLNIAAIAATPPLLTGALPSLVERLGALDGQTLAVLEAAHLLSEELAAALARGGAA
jgi:purine-binding chemotaxis protein CheW